MKFSYCLMNPPYPNREAGGMFLDMQFVELCNKISNINIVVYPATRFKSNTNIGETLQNSKHLQSVEFFNSNEAFKISSVQKYGGIYVYDNINNYNKIKVTSLDGKTEKINTDYESRDRYFLEFDKPSKINNIIKKITPIIEKLKQQYGVMVHDTKYYIYEENRLQRGKTKYGITKLDNKSLDRVKSYLITAKYNYCLYHGSYSSPGISEWNGEDPNKLFKGQICWLTNNETVKNNMKTWFNSTIVSLLVTYYLRVGCNGCSYGILPALDFTMNESNFNEYVKNIYNFTTDELNEIKKFCNI